YGTAFADGMATTLRNEDIGTLREILSQPVRYTFCISPINVESKLTAAAFVKMVRRFSSGQCLTYDWIMDMLDWDSIGQPENLQQLEHLEK
ncbi:hypothetical protein TELCIR_24982, partial [Teladorsagia circumcincta]